MNPNLSGLLKATEDPLSIFIIRLDSNRNYIHFDGTIKSRLKLTPKIITLLVTSQTNMKRVINKNANTHFCNDIFCPDDQLGRLTRRRYQTYR